MDEVRERLRSTTSAVVKKKRRRRVQLAYWQEVDVAARKKKLERTFITMPRKVGGRSAWLVIRGSCAGNHIQNRAGVGT